MSRDDDEWAVDADGVDENTDRNEEWDVDADSVGENDDEEGEWRFSLEDLEEAEAEDGTENGDEAGGNVFGTLQSATERLEPGSPSLENTAFVVLGIVLALLLFAQFLLVILGGP